jgi:hypothetical protein
MRQMPDVWMAIRFSVLLNLLIAARPCAAAAA